MASSEAESSENPQKSSTTYLTTQNKVSDGLNTTILSQDQVVLSREEHGHDFVAMNASSDAETGLSPAPGVSGGATGPSQVSATSKSGQDGTDGKRKLEALDRHASVSEITPTDLTAVATKVGGSKSDNVSKRHKPEEIRGDCGGYSIPIANSQAAAINGETTIPEASSAVEDQTTAFAVDTNAEANGQNNVQVAAQKTSTNGGQPVSVVDDKIYYRSPTHQERTSWKGFIELDSDCNTWNVLIKRLGVKGIELIDVGCLPDYPEVNGKFRPPVYGIIFCFDISQVYDVETEPCPKYVWFSNQLNSNSCGTIALLNVLANIPNADLGEELSTFRLDTDGLNSKDRGYTVAACDFVRAAHNSFARKIDMLEADMVLQTEYEATAKNKRKRRPAINIGNNSHVSKKAKKAGKMDLINKKYHFVAYVPVADVVWRLDGMDSDPSIVDTFDDVDGEDWMLVLKPHLLKILNDAPTSGFNIMALVPDGWSQTRHKRLAANICVLRAIDEQLNKLSPDWQKSIPTEEKAGVITGPNEFPKITIEMIEEAELSEEAENALEGKLEDLLQYRMSIVAAQNVEVAAIIMDFDQLEAAARKTMDRETDFGPIIHAWLSGMSKSKRLRNVIESNKGRK